MRVAAALVFCVGCSSLTSQPQYDQPKQEPLHFQVSSDPPKDDSGNITRDALLRVEFDDFPDPDTTVFGQLLLHSGNSNFDVIQKVDLVGKAVLIRPRTLLQPDTVYEIRVDGEFRALSGRKLEQSLLGTVRVGATLNPSPAPSPAPITWDVDLSGLIGGCANQCHTNRGCDPTRQRNPSSSLLLKKYTDDPSNPVEYADIHDPVLGLVNVPSVLTAGTIKPMMRVAPGDSANSMLLRKLLGGNPHADSLDPDTPDTGVPGRRMPLYEELCGIPAQNLYFNDSQLRLVQDWIDQGAN